MIPLFRFLEVAALCVTVIAVVAIWNSKRRDR